MASEINYRGVYTGSTLYFIVRNVSGQHWNTSGSPAFETLVVAHWGNYGTAMSESPASSYFYLGNFPSGISANAFYQVDIFLQSGGSPGISDTLVMQKYGWWNGTVFEIGAADAKAIGGTTQTGRDIGANVLLSVGTGTGQVNVASGKIPATVATGDDTDAASIKATIGVSGAGLTAIPAIPASAPIVYTGTSLSRAVNGDMYAGNICFNGATLDISGGAVFLYGSYGWVNISGANSSSVLILRGFRGRLFVEPGVTIPQLICEGSEVYISNNVGGVITSSIITASIGSINGSTTDFVSSDQTKNLDATISSRATDAHVLAIPTNPLLTTDVRIPATLIASHADITGLTTPLTAQQTADSLKLAPTAGAPVSGSVMAELAYISDNTIGAIEGLLTYVNNGVSVSGDGLSWATAKKTIGEATLIYSSGQNGVIHLYANASSAYTELVSIPANVELRGFNGLPELYAPSGANTAPLIIANAQSTMTQIRLKGQSSGHCQCLVQMHDNATMSGCSTDQQGGLYDCLFDFSLVGLGVTIEDCFFSGRNTTTAFANVNGGTTMQINRNTWNGWSGDIIADSFFYSVFSQNRFFGIASGKYAFIVTANAGLSISECAYTGVGQFAQETSNPGGTAPNSIINNNSWGSMPTQQYIADSLAAFAPSVSTVPGSLQFEINDLSVKTNNKLVWEQLSGAYTGKVFLRNTADSAYYAYSYARNPITLALITDPAYTGPVNFDAWTLI